jgi:nucleoside-diphosphate-sugar epimerase
MPGLVVAVTGATGFIGQALLTALARDKHQVRALTRKPRVDTQHIHWVTGTLDDNEALKKLVKGATAVVHCAGRVRGSALDEFLQTNVQGTINLVKSASQQDHPPRFLMISSLAAREPELSWYACSKYRGEQGLKDFASAMHWAVFRPTAVYGPGDRELTPLLKLTRFGLLPATVSGTARFGLLYVDDLVSAIVSWLKTETPVAGVFELDDGTPGGYDQQQIATIASQVWKRPVYALRVPAILLRILAQLNLVLARIFHYAPMLTPAKVRELYHPDWVCDISPLTELLDWKPVTDLQHGMSTLVLPVIKNG